MDRLGCPIQIQAPQFRLLSQPEATQWGSHGAGAGEGKSCAAHCSQHSWRKGPGAGPSSSWKTLNYTPKLAWEKALLPASPAFPCFVRIFFSACKWYFE